MYLKTLWNPGDIITTEKWNNINNNLYLHYVYLIPNTFSYSGNDGTIIIPMSLNELKQKVDTYGAGNCLLPVTCIIWNTSYLRYFYPKDFAMYDDIGYVTFTTKSLPGDLSLANFGTILLHGVEEESQGSKDILIEYAYNIPQQQS